MYKVIYIYICIYIYIYTYIPISHCIEPMFSEHLSPEAKGQVWVNAIGGVCKVWSRLQGAGCMLE